MRRKPLFNWRHRASTGASAERIADVFDPSLVASAGALCLGLRSLSSLSVSGAPFIFNDAAWLAGKGLVWRPAREGIAGRRRTKGKKKKTNNGQVTRGFSEIKSLVYTAGVAKKRTHGLDVNSMMLLHTMHARLHFVYIENVLFFNYFLLA